MKDVLELASHIKDRIKSCDITKQFGRDAIDRAGGWLKTPDTEELDQEMRWGELVDLHVLADIFYNRDMKFKTVSIFRAKCQKFRFPHEAIGYIYSRTAKGSALREAVVEEMMVHREPLRKETYYPKEFLFDLGEEYRNLCSKSDYNVAEEWETDDDDDDDAGISHIALKEKLSRFLDILFEGEDEDGEDEDEDEDDNADLQDNPEINDVDDEEGIEAEVDLGRDDVLKDILTLMVQVSSYEI